MRHRLFFSSRLVRPVHTHATTLVVLSLYISRLGSGCIDSTLIFMTATTRWRKTMSYASFIPEGIIRQDNHRKNHDGDEPEETMRCPYVTRFAVRRLQFD